jgi:cytochrome c peroxidase
MAHIARRILLTTMALTAACRSRSDAIQVVRAPRLVRPANAPLSAMARIGRQIFFDSSLSATGRVSCASCHDVNNAYGPTANKNVVPLDAAGGATISRATPSLRYVDRTPPFGIGPSLADADAAPSAQTAVAPVRSNAPKDANHPAANEGLVAHGGLFWDGRVNTLQDQAMGPLFNPAEMANHDVRIVARALRKASYANDFVPLFGAEILTQSDRLVDDAMFAVARFQIEDPTFHPYTSKYDYYLEGRATLTTEEERGLRTFDDARRGNCAACHLDKAGSDGAPPTFTDYEYEALAVPRNPTASRDGQNDLGACGPLRQDLRADDRYCGLFRTPSLRNVATRSSFFHNGVYRSLDQVLEFYNERETHPERIYPTDNGRIVKYDDLPQRYHANVDVVDAPFDRKLGDQNPMTAQDVSDIIAFLRTLTDGFTPPAKR